MLRAIEATDGESPFRFPIPPCLSCSFLSLGRALTISLFGNACALNGQMGGLQGMPYTVVRYRSGTDCLVQVPLKLCVFLYTNKTVCKDPWITRHALYRGETRFVGLFQPAVEPEGGDEHQQHQPCSREAAAFRCAPLRRSRPTVFRVLASVVPLKTNELPRPPPPP